MYVLLLHLVLVCQDTLTFFQVSAAILSIIIGWLSDRYKNRGIPIMCTVPLGIAGFFMLALVPENRPAVKYGAMYLAAAGIYGFQPLWLAWVCNTKYILSIISTVLAY